MVYNKSMLSPELIKKLKENYDFKQFIEYIEEEMSVLDSISDLGDVPVEKAGEEVKARAKAIFILKKILIPVINFREKADYTAEEIDRRTSKYGFK